MLDVCFCLLLICCLSTVGSARKQGGSNSLRDRPRNMYTQESFRSAGATMEYNNIQPQKVSPRRKLNVQERRQRLQQKQKQRRLADDSTDDYSSVPMNYTLDMDCGSLTGTACTVYIQNYLNTFINVNRSYNRLNLPVQFPHNLEDPPTEPSVLTPPAPGSSTDDDPQGATMRQWIAS